MQKQNKEQKRRIRGGQWCIDKCTRECASKKKIDIKWQHYNRILPRPCSAEQSRPEANPDGKKSYFVRIYPIRGFTEVTLNTNISSSHRGPFSLYPVAWTPKAHLGL